MSAYCLNDRKCEFIENPYISYISIDNLQKYIEYYFIFKEIVFCIFRALKFMGAAYGVFPQNMNKTKNV